MGFSPCNCGGIPAIEVKYPVKETVQQLLKGNVRISLKNCRKVRAYIDSVHEMAKSKLLFRIVIG
jgi:hypothetical protein